MSCVLHYTQQTLPLMTPVFRFLNFVLLKNPISPVFSFAFTAVAHAITRSALHHSQCATERGLSSCALLFLHRTFLLAAVVRVYSSTSHAYWLKITSLNGALLLVGRFLSRRARFVELRLKCNGIRAETRFLIAKKRTSPFQ